MISSDKIELKKNLKNFKKGSLVALSRLITTIEIYPALRKYILEEIYPINNFPSILGITGVPGAGKSTLINQLLFYLKKHFNRIAVLAFDPSSPISGGAFLGDRIRMKDHVQDDNIFIRSLATKGKLGGASPSVYDILLLLSSFGFDFIIIETVGVGQTEIEIRKISDLVLLLMTPTSGDSIQMLKAGILEIADIFIINKADFPISNKFQSDLTDIMSFNTKVKKPILPIVAKDGKGIKELLELIINNLKIINEKKIINRKRYLRFQSHIEQIIEFSLRKYSVDYFSREFQKNDFKEFYKLNPYDVAEKQLINFIKEGLND